MNIVVVLNDISSEAYVSDDKIVTNSALAVTQHEASFILEEHNRRSQRWSLHQQLDGHLLEGGNAQARKGRNKKV